jgi:hypothetical protein
MLQQAVPTAFFLKSKMSKCRNVEILIECRHQNEDILNYTNLTVRNTT